MPTLVSVQASVDTTMTTLYPTIVTRQTVFRGSRSRFFQGILTTRLNNIPNNTTAGVLQTMVPSLVGRPDYQAEDWVAFAAGIPGTLAFSLEIHNYFSLAGHGHVTITWIRHTNLLYFRARNNGPEAHRDVGWVQAGTFPA